MPDTNLPSLCVVIPTHGRGLLWQKAFESLQSQTLEIFEIVVVDNNKSKQFEADVMKLNHEATHPALYVHEPKLGLHYARHAALKFTSANLLIYTDDDATFSPRWLESYAQYFQQNPVYVAAGGPVYPKWEKEPPEWLQNWLKSQPVCPWLSLINLQSLPDATSPFFFGVNMAVRREALYAVQGFNPESFGNMWLGDGESGLQRKIEQRGWKIGFEARAVVYHHVPENRTTANYFSYRKANEARCLEYSFFQDNPIRITLILTRIFRATKNYINVLRWGKRILWRKSPYDKYVYAKMEMEFYSAQIGYLLKMIFSPNLRKLISKKDWLTNDSHGKF